MSIIKAILDIICATLLDPDLLEKARRKNGAFTRKSKKLPFLTVVKILICKKQRTYAAVLDEFYKEYRLRMNLPIEETITCSSAALCKARAGFDHSIFQTCSERVTEFLCKNRMQHTEPLKGVAGDGLHLIAIDGTRIPLPNRKGLLHKYGALGADRSSPTALASVAYDSVNGCVMDAGLESLENGERELAIQHLKAIKEGKLVDLQKSLFLFDRGYASEELIRYLNNTIKTGFLFRLRSKFNNRIDAIPNPVHPDDVVEQKMELYDGISVRVIKLFISESEVETLITNNFAIKKEEFKRLYFLRWPIEGNYKTLKSKIGLPDFRGYSDNSVLQEFWICILLNNIVNAIKAETDGLIQHKQESSAKSNKHKYQTNMNELVGSLSRYIDEYIDAKDNEERLSIIQYIINFAIHNKVVDKKGTGESHPRLEPRKVKFHYNVKRTH